MRRQTGLFISAVCAVALLCSAVVSVGWAQETTQAKKTTPSNSVKERTTEVVLGREIELKGNAGGSVRATQYGVSASGPCMGWIPKEAQHRIVLSEKAQTHIAVHSTADTTLILVGEHNGKPFVRCSDDVDGNDPALDETLPPGTYSLYVGTWNAGSRVPFTMHIRAVATRTTER